ncbi:MAG: hypothetical protein ABIB61_03070, partial [Candidatus Shapirobacteria bacterium]
TPTRRNLTDFAGNKTRPKFLKVSSGRNYWTKLEPFLSKHFCRELRKRFPAPDGAGGHLK